MLSELISTRRLLVTAGSGGVGKTTIAAAIAVRAAQMGRRTAVLTIDPARRLANSLGLDALTGELRSVDAAHFNVAGLTLAAPLSAMMLDTQTTGDQMVQRFAPDAETARAILENPYYKYFSTSLSGAQEYMAIEQVRDLLAQNTFDLVVLDTPPATHALEFLDAPDRLLSALDSPAMQTIRKARGRGEGGLSRRLIGAGGGMVLRGLSRLTGGTFLDDLIEFLVIFGSILEALREASREVHVLLREDSTRFLLVAAPNASSVDEALHFESVLTDRGLPFGAFICNRIHAPVGALPSGDEPNWRAEIQAKHPGFDVDALLARMQAGFQDHAAMATHDAQIISRLRDPITVPLLPTDVHDLTGLHTIGDWLLSTPGY